MIHFENDKFLKSKIYSDFTFANFDEENSKKLAEIIFIFGDYERNLFINKLEKENETLSQHVKKHIDQFDKKRNIGKYLDFDFGGKSKYCILKRIWFNN